MLKVGMFIQNRYEIISKIGAGGMADVYKAKDHKLNRFVAVKVLKQEFREDKVFISKFRVEAQSAAGLAHANIVNVYDVGEEAGINYIVMELVEGITLKEYIAKKGRLAAREATSIALQISAGLEAAHNNGIIHRDIKPQNIIISTDGKVKVTDFGIARATTSNTINSSVMGSVHYSSPEQSRGGYSDEKSDIYSLGITFYEMLVGHVPFDGDTPVQVAIRHLQEELRGPKELVPETPYSTNQIVLKCTQKSPDRRYANMSEVIRDLRESLVNPDGDFVTFPTLDNMSKTIVMSREEIEQIKAENSKMPAYDESLDVGAAAGLHDNEKQQQPNRAYDPGSYYQKSIYQGIVGGKNDADDPEEWGDGYEDRDEDHAYDPYYDAYNDPDDYTIPVEKDRKIERVSQMTRLPKEINNGDEELNSTFEKLITVGGIVVAVLLGIGFLFLLGKSFGIFDFMKKPDEIPIETEIVTEAVTESPADTVKQVSVPDLSGKTEKEAMDLLKSFGLTGRKTGEVASDDYEAGQVCNQLPAADEMVVEGTRVTFEVAEENKDIVLKDLKNLTQQEAQNYLTSLGLAYDIDTSMQNQNVADGHVIATEPAATSVLTPGTRVTIYVSTPPETEAVYVTMRDLFYYSQDVATEALGLLGLQADYIYSPNNLGVQDGWVFYQSVPANTQVAKGTTVTLFISTGFGEFTQEALEGMNQ